MTPNDADASTQALPFWLGGLRASAAFVPAVVLVVFCGSMLTGLRTAFLAFPFSLIRESDHSQIAVPGWLPNTAWCALAIVFGIVAWRRSTRALCILAPAAVVLCLVVFDLVLSGLGLFVRLDAL